jgi:hypothetical protein
MVLYDNQRQSGMSSGDLWQDSAVSAARLIEKYIHQEEQNLQLSECLTGGVTDYDRSGPNSQYIITEASCDSLSTVSSGRSAELVGTLKGTSFMYRSYGTTLKLWDVLDKSGDRSCKLPSTRYDITAVGIAESRDKTSHFLLVIATMFDVSLFYFNPDTLSDESPPTLSGYVATTGGVSITSICTANPTKRIFLGAEDGSVYELVYNQDACSNKISWPWWEDGRRCFLSVIYRPLISATLPPLFHSIASYVFPLSQGRVSKIEVDPCRQLLFVVSGKCSLSVYNMTARSLVGELSEYQLNDSLRSAFKASGNSFLSEPPRGDEIIEVIPSNPHVGGDVICVLVTRRGARIFIKGNHYSAVVPKTTLACKSCDKLRHYASYPVTSISVFTVRVPPTDLSIDFAVSPDAGRTIAMASQDNRGSGIAIYRPDESSIIQRQSNTTDRGVKFRERFDMIPVVGGPINSLMLLRDPSNVSDYLASVSSDSLLGNFSGSWRLVAVAAERELTVSPMTTSEQLLELVKSQNLYSIRDFSLQWRPEHLSSLLFELLSATEAVARKGQDAANAIETIERILFSPETASALGLIDSPGLGQSPQPSGIPFGPLGSVVQSQAQNISPRTRGIAIYLSRVLRPIWFQKSFLIETIISGNGVVVKPGVTSAQRQHMMMLLRPATVALNQYRHQLIYSSEESKIIEGFMVLLNAMGEAMELLRLFETGQLNIGRHNSNSSVATIDLLEGMDSLVVRDLAMSAGVGEPVLIELLKLQDLTMARKHCPLIIPAGTL